MQIRDFKVVQAYDVNIYKQTDQQELKGNLRLKNPLFRLPLTKS